MRPHVTQEMVDWLVDPEHQLKAKEDDAPPPFDPIRLAWPFKTDEERAAIAKWLRKERIKLKKKTKEEHIAIYGKALV